MTIYTIIAHDLRSPINSLNDMGIVLQHLIQEGKKQELDRVIQQIENMRQKTHLLLNNLFEWGKSQYFTPDVEEARQSIDVVPLLRELYQRIPLAKPKRLPWSLSCPQILGPLVAPGGLLMTVRNLLDNALKNTPAGERSKIEMSESFCRQPCSILFKANDHRYRQWHCPRSTSLSATSVCGKTQTRSRSTGMGLGMVLIHHFVQKNKAELTVESEVGKGTCFSIVWKP